MTYAIDTNIVIHYLRNEPNVRKRFMEIMNLGDIIVVPKIVDYEVRRGFTVQSAPAKERLYNALVGETGFCSISEMNDESWECAEKVYAELYQKRFTVGELDMLIVAFCLVNDCTLVTNNTKDFANIEGLDLVTGRKANKFSVRH